MFFEFYRTKTPILRVLVGRKCLSTASCNARAVSPRHAAGGRYCQVHPPTTAEGTEKLCCRCYTAVLLIVKAPAIRPTRYVNRNAEVQKFSLGYIALKKTAEKFLAPPPWRKNVFFFFLFFPATAAGGAICFFWLQFVNTLIESSCDDRRSIST